MKNRLLTIVAWLGIGIIALGMPLAFSSSATLMSRGSIGTGVGWWVAWILGILGTVLLLIAGFISKPRFLPLGAMVIGLVYISSFYGIVPWWLEMNKLAEGLATYLAPGLACIIGGIVLQRLSNRLNKRRFI